MVPPPILFSIHPYDLDNYLDNMIHPGVLLRGHVPDNYVDKSVNNQYGFRLDHVILGPALWALPKACQIVDNMI